MTPEQSQQVFRVHPSLRGLYELYATHPSGMWTLEWGFAKNLYDIIKQSDIKHILDLGTGVGASAAVSALALQDKGVNDYTIDTVENVGWLIDLAKELTPIELQKNVTYHHIEPIIWYSPKIKYQPLSTYKEIPEGEYDLIIHDGPGPFMEGEDYIDFPNGTITRLLEAGKLKPGTKIAWDKRVKALQLLERFYGNNFYLAGLDRRSGWIMLERKEGDVVCVDELKEGEIKNGYFETPQKQSELAHQTPSYENRNTGDGGDRAGDSPSVPGEPAQ